MLRIEGQKIRILKEKVDFTVSNDADLGALFKKIDSILLVINEDGP